MNSPEDMIGTNRVVIKAKDGSKVIITRDYINETLNYIVNFTCDISYILTDVAKECGYLLILHGVSIDEDMVTIEGTLMENVALKEEYHIINGNEFGKFTEAYVPYPEETTRLFPVTFCLENIKEMTGDLEMIQEMVDDNILSASTRDLIELGIIIKPQLSIIRNNDITEDEFGEINTPVLTIVNQTKVLKKQ